MTSLDLSNLPPTVTVPEAANLIGCSSGLLYRQIRAGTSPVRALCLGRRIVIPTMPLLELLGVHEEGGA